MGRTVTVTFLGTAGGVPTRQRRLPSILVEDWNGHAILLDAGEGVQYSLLETGRHPARLDAILVTHAHGDHINGLPGLLQTMYMMKRRKPLLIAGPPEVLEFVTDVLEAEGYRLGFEVRAAPLPHRGSLVLYRIGGDKLILRWARACHTVDSRAFRLEWALRPRLSKDKVRTILHGEPRLVREILEKGWVVYNDRVVTIDDVAEAPRRSLSIVYTGDTSQPCRGVVELARGASLLIHDATFDSSMEDEARERGHSTARLAAAAARDAGVKSLVLTHISARYEGRRARLLLEEAAAVFPYVILAWDGLRLRLRV
jgi:ribonuclease Z